jgi:hypothetical protein
MLHLLQTVPALQEALLAARLAYMLHLLQLEPPALAALPAARPAPAAGVPALLQLLLLQTVERMCKHMQSKVSGWLENWTTCATFVK